MALASENTVSSENQIVQSSIVFFLGNPNAKMRILILGNSITRHGPKADIGWENDWGMAATKRENDYVHRLCAQLEKDKKDVFIMVRQASDWERRYTEENILSEYEQEKDFKADIVIFRLGENVVQPDENRFETALRELIAHVCPQKGKTIYTTCFWENPVVDRVIENVAKERGGICLDGCLSKDKTNMALGQFAHNGVAMHPSDKGMSAMKELIYRNLKEMI